MSEMVPPAPRRERVTQPEGGRVMTKQADGLSSNINDLVRRWISGGVVPVMRDRPQYGDFSQAGDYLHAVEAVRSANADFALLPADVRKHVDNDPVKFLEMCLDPSRRAEVLELGLAERDIPAQAPAVTPTVTPVPPSRIRPRADVGLARGRWPPRTFLGGLFLCTVALT